MSSKEGSFFPEVGQDYSFAKQESKILDYWKSSKVFDAVLEDGKEDRPFYFYDGPPFATGLPHYGHILAGTIKDIVPRYWTQRGFRVDRRFGWDTHGLPVEFEIEKRLDLSGSLAIRDYGVAKFNEACRGAVLTYAKEWRETVERMGRWVDMDDDYKTMDPEFMESVWWVFSELYNKGLVYQGKKVVPYSWRLTAPLSNFEASLNYKSIQDPTVVVLLPLVDAPGDLAGASLAIWTTTPWTLPSNLAVAIQANKEKLSYGLYQLEGDFDASSSGVILANPQAESLGFAEDKKIRDVEASELLELHYRPIFSLFDDSERKKQKAFRVIDGSNFVVEGAGTGLVHCAPAFGEDDFYACQKAGIELVDPTNMEGAFSDEIKKEPLLASIAGVFVKDADKEIIKALKTKKRLLQQATLQHNYPFCERSDTPLIYKAISSWFVNVEKIKDQMLANNQKIHWVPGHIKDGRFGRWLEGARDWCISRNRFWGTPIPVWICDKCDDKQVMGSAQELSKASGKEVKDLHSHFVDELEWSCTKCDGGKMLRTPEVLDCWFESGSMPYAQEHYPFENKKKLESTFPADFIAEGLDQTRGWFYTLTILSTALFDSPAFKNCIVNGMVLAEDGKKMSKRLKNYPAPSLVFDKYGADALRLYLVQSPVMHGDDLRFSEKGLLELMRAVMLPLWNAYGFFASYANIDGWTPKELGQKAALSDLDQWILARVQETEEKIHKSMESYKLYEVAPLLIALIDDLTNWYIRLNRDRYWQERNKDTEEDKQAAYSTLYQVLQSMTVNMAPSLPFISELLNAHLSGIGIDDIGAKKEYSSIHRKKFEAIDELKLKTEQETLLSQVDVAKRAILLGRSLRGEAKIGLRQPLPKMRLAGLDEKQKKELGRFESLIKAEVNIKEIELVGRASDLVEESVKPNFKTLGRKLGKQVKELQKELSGWGPKEIAAFEKAGVFEYQSHKLLPEDIEVVRRAKEGKLAQADYGLVAQLDTQLSPELVREGVQRELINRIQQRRKEMQLHLTDRIHVSWWASPGSTVEGVLKEKELADSIAFETLCLEMKPLEKDSCSSTEEISEHGSFGFEITKI